MRIGSIPTSATAIKSITSPKLTTETSVTHRLAGAGRVVIAACDAGEVAHETSSLGHGLFTYYLLEGIKGNADQNQDGEVQLVSELYPYLYREVSQESHKLNVVQTPVLDGRIRGDICLVRVLSNPNRR